MNADSTKTQSTSSNNGNYRESLALHLPGYVILEDEVYVAQPETIGEQGNTHLLECFNKNINRNPEARHDKKNHGFSEKRFPWNIKGWTTKTETLNSNNDHYCENTAEYLPRFVVRDDSVHLKKSIIFKQRKTPSLVSINLKKCPNPKLKHRKTQHRLPPKNSLGFNVKVVGSKKNNNSSGNGKYLMSSAKTLSRYVIRYNKLYKTQTEIESRYTKSLMSMTKQNALISELGYQKEGNAFSKENIQAQSTNVGGFKTQEFSTTNNSYLERPALHLPGHVILDNDDDDDDDSDIQSINIFRPSKSHSMMCISQQNVTVPKKIHVKTNFELSQKKNSKYGIKGGGPKSQASCVNNEPYFGNVAQNLPRYVILDNNVYPDETEVEPKRISSNKCTNGQNLKIPDYDSNKLVYRLFNESIQASTENVSGKNRCSSKITEKKLVSYEVSGEDIYFTQSEIILEPRQTPSMECISQETNAITESITDKIDSSISSKNDADVTTKATQTKSKALSFNKGKYCENCSQLVTIYDVPEDDVYFRKSEMISESRKPHALASFNQLTNSVVELTYSETDISLSEKDTQTQTQESGSNNGNYCAICGEHLPIYGVTDDDIYFTQSQILLELRKTLPIEDISTQNAEVRNEKTDKSLTEDSSPDDNTKAGRTKMQESCLAKCNYIKTSAQDLPRYVFIDLSNHFTETKTKVKPKGTVAVKENSELTSQAHVFKHGNSDDKTLQRCIYCHTTKVARSKTQASNGNYCEYLVRHEVPDHDVYFRKSEMICEQRKTHDPEGINQRNNFKLELIRRRTDQGVYNERFPRHNMIASQTKTPTVSSNNINSSESCAKDLPRYEVPDHDVYFKESVIIFEFRKTRTSVCKNFENNLTSEAECSLLKETFPSHSTKASQTEEQALSMNSLNYCETCAKHLPKYEAPNRNVRFQNSEIIFEPRKTHESISKNQEINSIPESMPDKIGDALLNESYPDHITEVSQTNSRALSSDDGKYCEICEKNLRRYEVPDHDVYFKKSAMILEPRKTHASLWKPQRNKSIPELIREKIDDVPLNESFSCPITKTSPRETKESSTNGHYCENCRQPQPRSEVPDHDIYFKISEMVLTPRDTSALVRIRKQRNNSNLELARRKTDDSLPNESYSDLTTKACQTKSQTLSSDKNKYCENCAKHLSIYEFPDDDVYFTQPEIVLKPKNIDSLSHESLPISTTHTGSLAPSSNKFDYSDYSQRHLPRYVILRDNRNDTSCNMINEPGDKKPEAVSSNNDNYCRTCGLPLPIYGVANDDIYFVQSEIIFESRTTVEGTSKPNTSITGLTQGTIHDDLPEEKVPVHTMVAEKIEMNILSGNNSNFCKPSLQKLPIYEVPDDDVYFTQSKIIFEPRTTPSVWGITQRNNSIPLLIDGKASSGLPHENLPTRVNHDSKVQARSLKKSKFSDKSAKHPPRYVMIDDNVYRNALKTIHNVFN